MHLKRSYFNAFKSTFQNMSYIILLDKRKLKQDLTIALRFDKPHDSLHCTRSSHSIVRYAFVYIMRLTGHTHDRESPIQNFSTAPKKLGAHISSPVWPPKPTEFVSYLGNLRCDAFTALKSVQSARNESFLAGSDNFHRVRSAIEFEA